MIAKEDAEELFAPISESEITAPLSYEIGNRIVCKTDYIPKKASPLSLVVDATEGFIPLWEENRVLRWRFNAASLKPFQKPEEIKNEVRKLLVAAIAEWGESVVPIRFSEESDNSDFEIVVEKKDDCDIQGCTLAQAFFPDAGRHQLYVFPQMFKQSPQERMETMAHEIGHIFGLRHFFAPQHETKWPVEIFGDHKPFSIMNYGAESKMTDADRKDLKTLYAGAWAGDLKKIGKTPIKLVKPFHYLSS